MPAKRFHVHFEYEKNDTNVVIIFMDRSLNVHIMTCKNKDNVSGVE